MKISLVVRLVKLTHNRKAIELGKCPTQNGSTTVDFCTSVNAFLSSKKGTTYYGENQDKGYEVSHIDVKNDIICGILENGDKDIASTLHDTKTNKKTHARTTDELELIPHFFLLWLPKSKPYGILICQKVARTSIVHAMGNILQDTAHGINSAINASLNRYYENNTLYNVLAGAAFKEIQFLSHEIPSDIADMNNCIQFDKGKIRTTFTGFDNDLVKEIFGSNFKNLKKGINVKGGIEFNVGHQYDDVKMKVTTTQGKDMTVSVTQNEFDIDEDITDMVDKDSNKHPEYDSIKKIALDKLKIII